MEEDFISDFRTPPEGQDTTELLHYFQELFDRCRILFETQEPVPRVAAEKLVDDLDELFDVDVDAGVFDQGEDDFSERYLQHRILARSMLHAMGDKQVLTHDSIERAAVIYFFERLGIFFGLDVSTLPREELETMRAIFAARITKQLGRAARRRSHDYNPGEEGDADIVPLHKKT